MKEKRKVSLHVVLYQPEIPANTGNIGRTCLATDTTLHLIHPLGFSTEDKMLRRAGLDYWQHLDVLEHQSIDELYQSYPDGLFYYIENFGTNHYTDVDLSDVSKDIFFVFGSESSGIPKEVIAGKEDACLRIHMNDKVRSLNLSNTAAIIIYEALRQQNFQSLT
jgi:tRNA (cytidine/uridine-2'-O-)-methyltransferase